MKICPNCNKQNPSTFTRCSCGEDLSTVKNIEKPSAKACKEQAEKRRNIVAKVFIALFIILIVTFAALVIDGVSDTMDRNNNHNDGKCDICGKSAYGYLYGNEYCSKHYEDMK